MRVSPLSLLSWRQYQMCRILTIVGFSLIAYNEWISYTLYSWSWRSLPTYEDTNPTPSIKNKNQVNLLLVADPQIVGIQDEHWLLGYITRWDCDRYLAAGYRRALSHVDPTAVVFLGDLLDEGSQASEAEFNSYVGRFNTIFNIPSDVKAIYASGDNDVGGEGMDPKMLWKQERFFKNIPIRPQKVDDLSTQVQFLSFIRLSYDEGEKLDEKQLKQIQTVKNQTKSDYQVILNHMPISTRRDNTRKKVFSILKPNAVFSAHTHIGAISRCYMCRDTEEERARLEEENDRGQKRSNVKRRNAHWNGDVIETDDWSIHAMDLDDPYITLEITIPTCSYRMGVPNMGYGYATIDSDGILRYTVLWLPSRYTQLYSYLSFLIISAILLALSFIFGQFSRNR